MKILLLRHGETIWNTEGRLQGCQDIPLTDNGVEQIRTTGASIAALGLSIDRILSSPLQRAYKSAQIIAQALHYPLDAIITSPLFQERSFGECEGLTYSQALETYPDGEYPCMETLPALYERATQAIQYLEENFPNQTILVASHGAFIKAVLGVVTHGKIAYFDKDVWIENGTYCLLENTDADWSVSIHNRKS